MRARKKALVGRTIVGIDWGWRGVGNGHAKTRTTDPTIWLDNGRGIRFVVQECEDGYGVEMVLTSFVSKEKRR